MPLQGLFRRVQVRSGAALTNWRTVRVAKAPLPIRTLAAKSNNSQRNVLDIERDPTVVASVKEGNPMPTHRKPYSLAGSKPFNGSELTAINAFAKQNLLVLVQLLLPGGEVRGKEYVVPNPKRADKHPGSFKICVSGPKTGVWCDFAAAWP
jgi:hypothetical protein